MRFPVSTFWIVTAAAAMILGTVEQLQAQRRSPERRGGGDAVQVTAEIFFSRGEREQIRAYYTDHGAGSVEALPPGIRKNLARGKPIPPGLARRVLPGTLEGRLPVRDGYQRVQVGWDVLLVEVATGVIHDVLMDVIR